MAGQKMNKKAQVTSFIVIGLVILIAVSLFLYYRGFLIQEPVIIPDDLKPINNFVEACVQDVAKDAVISLGARGGYIEMPERMNLYDAFVEQTPGSLIRVPYWYFNGVNLAPSIESMQDSISNYIEENINSCTDCTYCRSGIFVYMVNIE